ncbi:MAG: thioredoxin domain-containing protein [Acidobacteriota bacterium]
MHPSKFTNKLINETSPYLLQHSHNPVDWYPWGDEAFERARTDDKPVIVSIGYSACHWCHVMEHESFEDERVAAIMNEHFVCIKVDMEERPDVDQIYMTFVQMTTGRGGWPMNVFVTPEKLPFFGGTYFPPDRRYNMPSWEQILMSVSEAYREKREEVVNSATDILGELRRLSATSFAAESLTTELLDAAFTSFERSFDAANGGFGGAPKFPAAMGMEFLLRYWKRTGDERALEIVKFTAEKMANGGIYDQLGGGFHRYSVDAVWLVPHFEKMLYDNAQLIRVYLHLFQITKEDFFKRIAGETLEYVRREMLDEKGGFYSTQDADSEGEEGKFFVWTPKAVVEILGEESAREFNEFYDVTEPGNFEEKNILNVKDPGPAIKTLQAAPLLASRGKLFEAREKRVKPFRDEKVLTAWNGLMLAAFAEAAAILDNNEYLEIAKSNAEFLMFELIYEGRLRRTWKDGRAKLDAYIEDYANFADGLIDLYQVSGEVKYLAEAKRLADLMITEFWDENNGGFFFTANDHEELIIRNKDFYDNATPSGNSVGADVLLKLAKLTGDEKYERFASTVLRLAAAQLKRHAQGFGRTLSAIEFYVGATKEIVLIGDTDGQLKNEVWRDYFPGKVVVRSNEPDAESKLIPLLAERSAIEGKPTAYVCENFTCKLPVTAVEDLSEQLAA